MIKDIERENQKFRTPDYVHYFHTMRWFLEFFGFQKEVADRKAEQKRQEQERERESPSELLILRRSGDGGLVAPAMEDVQRPEEEQNGIDYDQVASAMDLRAFTVCLRWLRIALDQKVKMSQFFFGNVRY